MALSSSRVLTLRNGRVFDFAINCKTPQLPADVQQRFARICPVGGQAGSRSLSMFSRATVSVTDHHKRCHLDTSNLREIQRREYHKYLVKHAEILKEKTRALQSMENNIIYNDDGIVAISKPSGLGVSGKVIQESEEGVSSSPVTIASLLAEIGEMTNSPAVEIAQGLEKEASGLVLLGENKVTAGELRARFVRARQKHQFLKTYRTIACGIPNQKEGVIKAYLTDDMINGKKMTVVRHDPPRKLIKSGEVVSSETNYRVINVNRDLNCALMELQPLRVRRHQLQVHLTNLLCPILGDHLYSHQVQTILGVPMLMDPYKVPPSQTIQVLNADMRKTLSLTNRQVSLLPHFLHLHRIIIPNWRGEKDVELTAPDPPIFSRTLKLLGLDSGEEHVPMKYLEHGR